MSNIQHLSANHLTNRSTFLIIQFLHFSYLGKKIYDQNLSSEAPSGWINYKTLIETQHNDWRNKAINHPPIINQLTKQIIHQQINLPTCFTSLLII